MKFILFHIFCKVPLHLQKNLFIRGFSLSLKRASREKLCCFYGIFKIKRISKVCAFFFFETNQKYRNGFSGFFWIKKLSNFHLFVSQKRLKILTWIFLLVAQLQQLWLLYFPFLISILCCSFFILSGQNVEELYSGFNGAPLGGKQGKAKKIH